MINQWILLILCVIMVVYMLVSKIYRELRVFLIKKSSKFIESKKEAERLRNRQFYNTFGFYYEDIIKYAPELDEFITNRVHPQLKDRVAFKMIKMREIYDAINTLEQVDIIKFKQTIENIKNQKALENIDG